MPSSETSAEMETVPVKGGPAIPPSQNAPERKYGWPSRLRSYFILDPLVFFYTFLLGMLSLPFGFLNSNGRILHGFARLWSRLIMATILCPVKVTGLENISSSRSAVIAANHASALDIPILYANLPFQFRIAFKSELLAYPIVGWHLKRSGQVCIDQQNPARSIGSIRSALKGLKAGMPLVIFPEGGRSPDGGLKPFLPGAFFLAIKSQVDVVPVALVGTFDLLPMNTYHIKCRTLEMRIGEPISTVGLSLHDMETLSRRVHVAMAMLLH
jgi:1-acyl-sn-glycerol-3-phosphate acyltransferase